MDSRRGYQSLALITISHDWLLDARPHGQRHCCGKWLKAGFLEKHVLVRHRRKGHLKAGSFHPSLANWTLDGLQRLLAERFAERTATATEEQSPPGPLCG